MGVLVNPRSTADTLPEPPHPVLPSRVYVHHRIRAGIAIDTRPIHQPQRVGLDVPSGRRVIVPHPVLVQAGLALKPLAGEAEVWIGAGGGLDPAEGQIGRLPDLCPAAVRRKHRPPDMIGAHEVERPVLKHPNNRAIRPDILADQAAGVL